MIDRRTIVASAAVLAAPRSAFAAAPSALKNSAREAWLYGLPLITLANSRQAFLAAPNSPGVNRFLHERRLAPAGARGAPNNDTLYSNAWLDLSAEPVTLTIPSSGGRYLSVAILNMYSVTDVVLGSRVNGGGGGRFMIAGPGYSGRGRNLVRATTPHAWVTARILVDGPSDLRVVHALQDTLHLAGATGMTYAPAAATRASPALDYFSSLAGLIRADPPLPQDAEFFRSIQVLGLTPAGGFHRNRFSAEDIAELQAGVDEARAFAAKGIPGEAIQGWSYRPAHHGLFGRDYRLRGATAFSGLGALPQAEAMYMSAVGEQGRLFTGTGPYRLRFEPGRLPPVSAFWSLTLYGAAADGQLFLADNPLQRFAIGDRTPGLRTSPDGSLEIWIAREDPGADRRSNWLPAPAEGSFALTFRAYVPKPPLLDGRYRLPPLERV